MLGFPAGCQRANCLAYVEWRMIGSDRIYFELEGAAEGWVAVGVSADRVMGGDGIDDVFACQRDVGQDFVYGADTYNAQSTRQNIRDSVSGVVRLLADIIILRSIMICHPLQLFPFSEPNYRILSLLILQ